MTGDLRSHVATRGEEIDALVPAWRSLAATSAGSPFESPDWLVPWWRHYGAGREPRVLTWWADDELVGVAPLVLGRVRRGPFVARELDFWGATATPLRGWVDVVAREDLRGRIADELAERVARDRDWDLVNYLRLPAASPTVAALRARWARWHIRLTGAVRSLSWVVDLPADREEWRGYLSPKARHNIRRELRIFEKRMAGRLDRVADPGAAGEIVAALRGLMTARWGAAEAYFRADPRFEAFAADALRSTLAAGIADVLVARDPDGIQAALVCLRVNRRTTAVLIGMTSAEAYRPFSLGKVLFHRAIDDAVAAGSATFDFLAVGGYKESFWHARPEPLESGILARGAPARALAAYSGVRRVLLPRAVGRLQGRLGRRSRSSA